MEYVNSSIALEVNRLYGWTRDVWDDRYHAILVSNEEPAQVDRLRYLLSHGVKEGLVAQARAHLTPEGYRQRLVELVEAVETEARAELARTGRVPLGVAAILRRKPDECPA